MLKIFAAIFKTRIRLHDVILTLDGAITQKVKKKKKL